MSVKKLSTSKIHRKQQFAKLFENLETRRLMAATYTVKNLFPNDSAAIPYGISNNGHVALGSSVGAAVYFNNVTTKLNIPGQANDVNDAGQVAGTDTTTAVKPVAYIYENGAEKKIPTLGGSISYGNAINASGDVVGSSTLASGNGQHAFLYSHATGKVTDLGLLPGGTNSVAQGINASGQIVGIADIGGGVTHGFLYSNGVLKDLGVLPGGAYSGVVHGINNAGLIVGYSATSGSLAIPTNYHVVTSQAGAALKDVGAPSNTTNVQPCDVNADGTVVGLYDDSNFSARGFVESGGTFKQLDTLIDPTLKINIYDAYSVNDSGVIVVLGSAGASDGVAAYTLTPVAAAPTTGTVSGIAYKDTNGNGKQDAGETGLAGVNVFAGADGFATTAADGTYSMTLAPGSYYVYAGTPSGYSATTNPTANLTVTAGKNTAFTIGETPSNAGAGKSTINGTVFNDANNDGVLDNGETGIKGITVSLTQSGQASFARVAAAATAAPVTVTTDANGKYSFTGLSAGEYIVADTVPAIDTQTAPASGNYDVTLGLAGSQTVSGKDFGLKAKPVAATHSVSGTVYNDTNDDSKLSAGESGFGGITVTITPTSAGATATKTFTTTASGAYSFSGLADGTYTVSAPVPAGYTKTSPSEGNAFFLSFTSGNGDTTGANFGFYKAAAAQTIIGGTVYNDANGDGSQDNGETGIKGVTVTVTQTDAVIGQVKASAAVSFTAVTDSTGHYAFTDIPYNKGYDISVAPPSGFTQVNPSGKLSVFLADAIYPDENFGLKQNVIPPVNNASITGTVYSDANQNGKQDAGEAGLANVEVRTALGNTVAVTTTDASGVYLFKSLPAGTYKTFIQTPPAGYMPTTPAAAGYSFDVTAGQAVIGKSFGEYKAPIVIPPTTGSITGLAFNDANDNGQRDNGEGVLSGVTIHLQLQAQANLVKTAAAAVTSVVTGADGTFTFANLPAGSYAVYQDVLKGYTQTVPQKEGYSFNLTAGQNISGQLFGQFKTPVVIPPNGTGTITGTLFNDSNGNGVKDASDGVTGVRTVFLDTNGNGKLDAGEQSTTSDAAGKYTFSNVATGTAKVTRVFPAGYRLSNPSAGTNGLDVVVTVTNGATVTANIGTYGSSKAPTTPPVLSGTIAGTLWNDSDSDGVYEPAVEAGSGIRTVFIDTDRDGVLDAGEVSTKSDANGHYTFKTMPTGTFAISRLFPDGYFLSNPSAGTNGKDVLVTLVGSGTVVANIGTRTGAQGK